MQIVEQNNETMVGHQRGILDSEQSPQFWKYYDPKHCSKELGIPQAFIKYFKGAIPSKLILMTSARKLWEVEVNKVDGGYLYLQSGWEQFVQHNFLEFGDVLVFYQNGESKFFVSIFGKNNCQKHIVVSNKENEKRARHIQGNETKATGKANGTFVGDGNFSFEVTMYKSYLTRGHLYTPRAFYQGLKEYRSAAKLQHLGRTWDVKVLAGISNNRIRFCQGWDLFVKENCLAVEDICTFTIVDIKPEFYVINVSFSRAL